MIIIQYRVKDSMEHFMGFISEVMLCECCANIHCFTLFKTHPNINSALITGKIIQNNFQEKKKKKHPMTSGQDGVCACVRVCADRSPISTSENPSGRCCSQSSGVKPFTSAAPWWLDAVGLVAVGSLEHELY